MKQDKRHSDLDSSSTHEREKRFSRRSIHKNSRSKSNHSESSSLSKFFVRNVEKGQKVKDMKQIMHQRIKTSSDLLASRAPSHHGNLIKESNKNLNKNPKLSAQYSNRSTSRVDLQKLSQESLRKDNKTQQLEKENLLLRKTIRQLETQLEKEKKIAANLRSRVEELGFRLNQQENLAQRMQKSANPLKKVKDSILQSRVEELEKDKSSLTDKIFGLEKNIEELSSNKNSFLKNVGSWADNKSADQSLGKIETELYLAKQQAHRLKIELTCQQHKYYNEVEGQRRAKDQEYNQLKKKFAFLSKKYKGAMKEASARKIEDKAKQPEENESLGSLTLSSDEEAGNR